MTEQEKMIMRAIYMVHQEVIAVLSLYEKDTKRPEYLKQMNNIFLTNVFQTEDRIGTAEFDELLDAYWKSKERENENR